MVRLTADILVRCSSSYTKKHRDESRKHYLRRVTHLHLEDRCIDEIGDELQFCRNLTVLYMYDNLLTCLPNLSRNSNLTHVYLQNNCIDRIEGLESLTKITKLYLGGNNIVVLEGLESLEQLQELHMENQRLPDGEKLLFDVRSLQSIAGSLMVLNISGNGVTSVAELDCLTSLQQLMVADNNLRNIRELARLLSTFWRRLQRLDVANNPLCRRSKYRDRIIVAAPSLEMLDGVEVSETAKQFLRNWRANKEAVKQRIASSAASAVGVDHPLHDENSYSTLSQKSSVEMYPTVPATYLMPALNGAKFQQFLARSRSQQSASGAEPVDRHAVLTSLLGYSNVYSGSSASRIGAGEGLGSNLRHLALRNISLDCLNTNVPL